LVAVSFRLFALICVQNKRNIAYDLVFQQSAAASLQQSRRSGRIKPAFEEERESMNNQMRYMALSAALAVFTLPAIAQSSNPSTPAASAPTAPSSSPSAPAATTPPTPKAATAPTVRQRDENQQDRISQGVASGQLTAGEASNLENKEKDLNVEQHEMRQLDNGHLTAADKATLQQQQNQVSNQIYKDKHNAAVQNSNPKGVVGSRAENQQGRIAQGVSSGQLDATETSHLEKGESRINQEARSDRAANGGKLTAAEQAKINGQQNRLSKQIYKDKHNSHHQ
jgi:hypothetical protein